LNRAAFLDRDGVINVDKGYVHRVEDVEFVAGVFDVCHWLVQRDFCLVVVTNQTGVARGFYTEQDVLQLHAWFAAQFARRGIPLKRFYYCPHHPELGHPPYKVVCPCRKPAPGMLLRAQQDCNLDLARSLLIGDRESDIEAGRTAGLAVTIRVQDEADGTPSRASIAVPRLRELLAAPAIHALERLIA
jgi:D-glycero-D-manno-heptose 1,7-bisphosphate phosphatase